MKTKLLLLVCFALCGALWPVSVWAASPLVVIWDQNDIRMYTGDQWTGLTGSDLSVAQDDGLLISQDTAYSRRFDSMEDVMAWGGADMWFIPETSVLDELSQPGLASLSQTVQTDSCTVGTYGDGAYLRDRLDLLGEDSYLTLQDADGLTAYFTHGADDEAREDYSIYLHPDSTLGSLWGEIFDWTGRVTSSQGGLSLQSGDPWQQLYTHTFDNAQAWDTYGAKGECTLTFYWLDNYSSRYDWYRVDLDFTSEVNSDDYIQTATAIGPYVRDMYAQLGVSSTTGTARVYSNGGTAQVAPLGQSTGSSINTYALGASLFNYTAAGDPRYTRSFTVRDVIYNQSNNASRVTFEADPRQPNFSNWPPSYTGPSTAAQTGFSFSPSYIVQVTNGRNFTTSINDIDLTIRRTSLTQAGVQTTDIDAFSTAGLKITVRHR